VRETVMSERQIHAETDLEREERLFGWRDYVEVDCRHWYYMPADGDDVPHWGSGLLERGAHNAL
jgi:hypothetical protein